VRNSQDDYDFDPFFENAGQQSDGNSPFFANSI